MNHRNRVAELWDRYMAAWISGESALKAWIDAQGAEVASDLATWQSSYSGTGRGALDLDCFPDPFTGDLRGVRCEPTLVVLGLNPGVGYPELHGREGKWTNRIRESTYSRCFERSPPGDMDWIDLYGRESTYWRNLIAFGKRWCGHGFSFQQLLNLELYPWHSNSLTAGLQCPPRIVERYVIQPLAEVNTNQIFAFGKPWLQICMGLNFDIIAEYGDNATQFPGPTTSGWRVVVFRSRTMKAPIVVSWQKGYAGPPGKSRISTLRTILDNARR
ncbi:MAG: hypothetical protein QM784_28100 [Polyangiaceae bacterium]